MICERCTTFVQEVLKLLKQFQQSAHEGNQERVRAEQDFEFITSIDQLRSSDKQGCHICRQILNKCDNRALQDVHAQRKLEVSLELGDSFVKMSYYLNRDQLSANIHTASFSISPLQHVPVELSSGDHRNKDSTGDRCILDLALQWLRACLQSHPCCKLNGQNLYPSRLIDLAPTLQGGNCRIIQGSSKLQGGYISLSHKWGDNTPILTRKNFEKYRSEIPWEAMPGIFRDAIKIAQVLGIRYLWIDSICVFQDNKEDIAYEVARMQEVYANALCNIAALTARTDSLFSSRDPSRTDSHNVILDPLKLNHGLDTPVLLHDEYRWHFNVDRSPLSRRGWVLQEQLLARRTLYYGADQIFWECRAGRRNETYPTLYHTLTESMPLRHVSTMDPIIDTLQNTKFLVGRDAFTGAKKTNNSDVDNDILVKAWTYLVQNYTNRSISFPQDRLLAISGIAEKFSHMTHYRWAAGLWEEQLPLTLLWHVEEKEELHTVPNGYCCPSWSWASQSNAVVFVPAYTPESEYVVVSKLLDIDCKTMNNNTFGDVPYGNVRIAAPTIDLAIDMNTNRLALQSTEDVTIALMISLDRSDGPFKSRNDFKSNQSPVEPPHQSHLRPLGPAYVAAFLATYGVLSTKTAASRQSPDLYLLHGEGLLLEKVGAVENTGRASTYCRIGMILFRAESTNLRPSWAPDIFRAAGDTFNFDSTEILQEFIIV